LIRKGLRHHGFRFIGFARPGLALDPLGPEAPTIKNGLRDGEAKKSPIFICFARKSGKAAQR
jgi:hypothetical protein